MSCGNRLIKHALRKQETCPHLDPHYLSNGMIACGNCLKVFDSLEDMKNDAVPEDEDQEKCSCICHTQEDKEKTVCASCLCDAERIKGFNTLRPEEIK